MLQKATQVSYKFIKNSMELIRIRFYSLSKAFFFLIQADDLLNSYFNFLFFAVRPNDLLLYI